jgi:hypothetical protein
MSRRKEPAIANELLDQLLAGGAASAAFEQGGLLNSLKKALTAHLTVDLETSNLFRCPRKKPLLRPPVYSSLRNSLPLTSDAER